MGFNSGFKGLNAVKPGYNDIGLRNTSSITSTYV